MNLYWNTENPLSRTDLVDMKPELNRNTIHVMIPRLLKDRFLRTAKIIQTKTVLTRAYRPTISRIAYLAKELGYKDANDMILSSVREILTEDSDGEGQKLAEQLEKLLAEHRL